MPDHAPDIPSTSDTAAPDTPRALPAPADLLAADENPLAYRDPRLAFPRARQALFLERLAECGNVRSAARSAGVSHQTAYRARRACANFALVWDAALMLARVHAEEVLQDRALNGVEEEVWYHGEIVATRRRFSDRLLLAHLARLDRQAIDGPAGEVAADFDHALRRLRRGDPVNVSPRLSCAYEREGLRQALGAKLGVDYLPDDWETHPDVADAIEALEAREAQMEG